MPSGPVVVVSLSLAFLVVWGLAPPSAGPEPALPPEGAAPLDGSTPAPARPSEPSLPSEGAAPLGEGAPGPPKPVSRVVPPEAALPLGRGPKPEAPPTLDPRLTRLVRLDFLLGPVWRIRKADTLLMVGAEAGRMRGLSGTFHTAIIVPGDRDVVQVLDVPIGGGVVARGQLRNKPLYGSVGLSAGILVHRARTEHGVIHRVDPDVRLPLRVAWTIAGVGASVAVVPGYSVRERTYERRGAVVWNRHSVRIGLLLGLHWDIVAGRAKLRRPSRPRDGAR